jgi:hypothetical protein
MHAACPAYVYLVHLVTVSLRLYSGDRRPDSWSGYRFIVCSCISAVGVVSDHDHILNSPVALV